MIPLAEQERSRRDRDRIRESTELLDGAIASGRVCEYELHVSIAALLDRAPTAAATDWTQIHAIYEILERMTGIPIVRLNRAVAAGRGSGAAASPAVRAAA